MTMFVHAHSAHVLREMRSSASIAAPHTAMIRRFFKFVLAVVVFTAAVAGIMAIRVVAWFPHFHQ